MKWSNILNLEESHWKFDKSFKFLAIPSFELYEKVFKLGIALFLNTTEFANLCALAMKRAEYEECRKIRS